jgi:phenylalanyl-tRNA synthetase beta chain
MVGFGGIECLTYGFIPENAMQVLRLDPSVPRFYGDIKILNPLSAPYALMRPTLAYGLIDTAADNIKRGVTGIHIFEPGKTFFRDPGHEDGYNERNTLGAVLYGVSVPKGYGIVRDNNYSIYDAHALVKGVLDAFNVSYVIQKTDAVGMFKQGSGGYILVGGTMIGVLGIVDTAVLTALGVENIAVADMLYIELDYTSLEETKRHIEQERLFPGVTREYNLIVKNGTYFADYRKEIERAPGVIQTAAVDVYTGKGIEKGYASVLVRVEYSFPDRAVALDEVVAAERQFLAALGSKYGIALKA